MAVKTQVDEVWSDLDHRLIQDAQGNLKKVINVESVMVSIDNILRTYRGERVMIPEFASALKSLTFESMTKPLLDFLSRDIKETIERWDDRVLVSQIRFLAEPDYSSITLEISFVIKGYSKIFVHEMPVRGEV